MSAAETIPGTSESVSEGPQAPLSRPEARAQVGWARVRRRVRSVSPVDVGRTLLAAVTIALGVWLAVASWPALLPFAAGALLAYALMPLVNGLSRVMPRGLAALVTLLAFFAVAGALLYALVPPLMSQLLRFYRSTLNPEALADYSAQIEQALLNLQEPSRSLLRAYIDQIKVLLQARLDALIAGLADASIAGSIGLVGTLSSVIGLILLPLWILGIMIGQRRAGPALRQLLPERLAPDVFAVIKIVDRVMNAFLRGQLLIGIAVGVTLFLEVALIERFTSVDFNYPVLMSVLAALPALVPQIGPLLGLIIFAILGFGISPQIGLLVIAMYALALLVVNNVVAPRLQRRLTDLNPALLVLFITALSHFGLIWALLSAPLLAVARDLLRYAGGRIADHPRPAGLLPGEPVPPSTARRVAKTRAQGKVAYRNNARTR